MKKFSFLLILTIFIVCGCSNKGNNKESITICTHEEKQEEQIISKDTITYYHTKKIINKMKKESIMNFNSQEEAQQAYETINGQNTGIEVTINDKTVTTSETISYNDKKSKIDDATKQLKDSLFTCTES